LKEFVMTAIGFEPHDHGHCIAGALRAAQARCRAQKLRFTPVRRRVLEILLRRHQALGAYEILEVLRADGFGAQPPVAYRALDFLVRNGLAHRIEAVNAYAACVLVDHDHVPAFLICRACKTVAEAETGLGRGRLGGAARAAGFVIERVVIEAQGLCPACSGTGA
jgi:Fur family transcriptional regulator, zinc uptake regulator